MKTLVCSLTLILAAVDFASAQGITVIPPLGGSQSEASGVSDNGIVSGGGRTTGDGFYHALRWEDGTSTDLGTFGGTYSYAAAISSDGTTIVGQAYYASPVTSAFRWTQATGMVDLGHLGGGTSRATAVNANGSAIVGTSYNGTADSSFLWTESSGMLDLGTGGATGSEARDLSDDASVIVGYTWNESYTETAYRWTIETGIQSLGTLGGSRSVAEHTTSSGSVIVGYAENELSYNNAFLWTEAGGMVSLGSADTNSFARSISDDGLVVVGQTDSGAMIWDQDHGMRSLNNVLLDEGVSLANWALWEATDISYLDGFYSISGWGFYNGQMRGFVATVSAEAVPEPSTYALLALGIAFALITRLRRIA